MITSCEHKIKHSMVGFIIIAVLVLVGIAMASTELDENAAYILKIYGSIIAFLIASGIGLITYTYRTTLNSLREVMELQINGVGSRVNNVEGRVSHIEGLLHDEYLTVTTHNLICDKEMKPHV